mmetsp:Transcript_11449/g.26150  ORF Transcript_11449/g.26150 Transcript_11449/m.26150 type:complete len:147 (-) Transcript_11449:90-530(-)
MVQTHIASPCSPISRLSSCCDLSEEVLKWTELSTQSLFFPSSNSSCKLDISYPAAPQCIFVSNDDLSASPPPTLSPSFPSFKSQTLLAGIRLQTPSPRPKLGKIQTKRLLQSSLEEEGEWTWVDTEVRRPEVRRLYNAYMSSMTEK